jgi:hypothetical protein
MNGFGAVVHPVGPWFRRRPMVALAVATGIYLGVATYSWAFANERAIVAVALALAVALLGVTFGRRGGVVGGVVATALYAVWSVAATKGVGFAGWASVPALLLFGYLLGEAVDELEASEGRRREAEEAGRRAELVARRHREAIEINDNLVQGVAAAKWALEAGNTDWALQVMQEAVIQGERMVSELLRDSGAAPLHAWQGAIQSRGLSFPDASRPV